MVRFCICWLVCCSLLPFPARAADTPISAEFFLQSIEPEPSATMLHDFLDIYGATFAACKETDTYLRALSYLATNGDLVKVRDRLKRLETCTDLSAASRQRLTALREQIAGPRASEFRDTLTAPLLAASTPPVSPPAKVPAETPAPPVVSEPASVMPPPAVQAPSMQAPQTQAPSVQAPVPSETPPAEPAPTVSPEPLSQPAPIVASAVPVPPVAPSETLQPPTPEPVAVVTTPAPPKPTIPHAKTASALRRTSLPVTPTIPMPSRALPSPLPGTAPQPLPEQPATPDVPPVPALAETPAWHTEAASRIIYRTGDEGTSRLLRSETSAAVGYENWTFSATALYLNAGTAGNNVFAGSYFRGSPQQTLRTEQTAFIPQIAYDGDAIDVSIGLSPLGGDVSPLPTFRISYAGDHLKLAAFQESVTDSLLSYTGFRDPFTGKRMGRVLRTGVRMGWDDTFAENWFYGGAITGAWLYGENVKDNTQVRGELYLGRAFGQFAVGSYSAVDHYRTNLNNYTFGHGGYYSPYLAASSVLFASWEYAGTLGRLKADVSSGFLYETTRDSDQYYGTDGPNAVYKGETHRRLTINAGLEGSLNLAENLTLNSALRVINAGDFTEARGALSIKWAF